MQDDLLLYYERELAYLRRMGAQFAERYPKVASRLLLEPSKCEDPHVERLLEGFAFLAARVHHRIDDDIPELSEAFLEVLYPQHVRPVPAHLDRRTAPRSDAGRDSGRLLGLPWQRTAHAAGAGRSVSLPHGVRHHALADQHCRRAMDGHRRHRRTALR
jgi:hypothetical protein